MNHHRRWLLRGLLLPALLAGCSDERIEEAEISTTKDEIIAGTQPADGSLQALGVVQVTSIDANGRGSSCTGTLISNQFVMTARHCIRLPLPPNSWAATLNTSIAIRSDGPGGVDQNVASAGVTENVGMDYAMIRLERPVVINGEYDALYNPVYTQADSTLGGQTVTCVGYGNNAYAVPAAGGNPARAQTGANTLRTANMVVSSATGNFMTLTPNGIGQVPTAGDSGSTCFLGGAVTGVQSTCTRNTAGPNGGWADANNDGIQTSNEFTLIASCAYVSPDAHRTSTNGIVIGDVSVSSFTFSPGVTDSVSARLTSVLGTSTSFDAKASSTFTNAVLRAGWMQVSVPNEPPGMMCGVVRQTAPLTGQARLTGSCLGDGVVSTVLGMFG